MIKQACTRIMSTLQSSSWTSSKGGRQFTIQTITTIIDFDRLNIWKSTLFQAADEL